MATIPTVFTLPLAHAPDLTGYRLVGDIVLTKTPNIIKVYLSHTHTTHVYIWFRGWIEHGEWYIQPNLHVLYSIASLLRCDPSKLMPIEPQVCIWTIRSGEDSRYITYPMNKVTKLTVYDLKWSDFVTTAPRGLRMSIAT